MNAVTAAAQYWVDVLKPHGTMPLGGQGVDIDGNPVSGSQPVVINVGTVNENNAFSYDMLNIQSDTAAGDNPYLVTPSMKLLADGTYVDPNTSQTANGTPVNAHGVISIGTGWTTSPSALNQSGRYANDLMPVLMHELGHTLGISSPMEYLYGDELSDEEYERWASLYKFPNELTRWQAHLRDNNGNPAVPGAYPNVDGKPVDYDPTHGRQYIFDMGDPNSPVQPANFTFVGKNALELWYGKPLDKLTDAERKTGIPLQGLTLNDEDWDDDKVPNYLETGADRWFFNPGGTLSHTNLRNSEMSCQMYRNYPMFLEIELAVMQDIGYNIDRSSFFGKSFYVNGDGSVIRNSTTFNSLSAYGVGAHLFADNLNIIQTENIQARGPGAAGIRVDGVGNTLTIAPSTAVISGLSAGYKIPENLIGSFRNYGVNVQDNGVLTDGIGGTGLLVSYGKDHQIIHRGTIIAEGKTGTAVRFDFGEPMVGARLGSYAFDPYYGYMEEGKTKGGYPEELQGPLVKSFDITGTIKGGRMLAGIPFVYSGGDDRVITRGNDTRFTGDKLTGDIFRIFNNGKLDVPDQDWLYLPQIQADARSIGGDDINKNISTVVINPNDGTGVIIYDTAVGEEPNHFPEPHIYICDPGVYRTDVTYERTQDENNVDTYRKKIITVTHIVDKTFFRVEIGEVGEGAGKIATDIPDTYTYYTADNYDPKSPDVAVIITYKDKDGKVERVSIQPSPPMNGNFPDNLPELLKNYRIGYRNGCLDLRTLEDNQAEPWKTYVTPNQDETVWIPGGGAAIYIAGNQYAAEASASLSTNIYQGGAHVETINVMRGAVIDGDIISEWNSIEVPDLQDRGTTLTFGLKPDTQGQATALPDSDFNFVFKDNINAFQTFKRAYINDRPGEDDISRWGDYNYDESLGGYVNVGEKQGRYKVEDSWKSSGKIDLHFAGGYTEFQAANGSTQYYVTSVVIDQGATFSLGAVNINKETGRFVTPSLYTKGRFTNSGQYIDGGTFVNNGRFSGEGEVWVGAERIYNLISVGDQYGTVSENPIGYYGSGNFVNRGTIAPGPNNGYGEPDRPVDGFTGQKTGTLAIAGNLDLRSQSSVYECTISDGRTTSATTPGWDNHPDWVTNRVWKYEDRRTEEFVEYLTSEYPNSDLPWNIDPATGLPVHTDKELIGGGWGYGDSDRLVVSGTTTLGGTLVVHVTPGDYSPNPTTYTIIRSEGGYTPGTNFTNIEHYIGFLTFQPYGLNASDTYITGKDLQFTVIRDADYFKKHAKTFNELAAAAAIDNSLSDSYKIAFSLADDRNTEADLRSMYHQIAGAIRANGLMLNLWNPSEVLFPRIGWGNGQMETGQRGRIDWNRIAGRRSKILGQEPDCSSRTGSLWGEIMNTAFSAATDGNSDGYSFNRTGFMAGNEWSLTPYSAVGGMLSYHNSKLKQAGDKTDSDDYILGAYLTAAPFNTFEFKMYLGLGMQEYDSSRRIYNSNIITDRVLLENGGTSVVRGVDDRYTGNTKGNSFNFSLELAKPIELHPTFILRPAIGLDIQEVWQSGYLENNFSKVSDSYGSNIYALRYQQAHYSRGLFRAGFGSETSGSRGGIQMRAFYVSRVAGSRYPLSTAAFGTGGERFTVRGVDLGSGYLNLGVGANYYLDGQRSSSLFFDYNADIYSVQHKVNAHLASIGLLQRF